MLRPVFILKVLIFSVIINLIFVVYFLTHNADDWTSNSRSNGYYGVNDYNAFFESLPISPKIKILPLPMSFSIDNSKVFLSSKFHIVSNQKPSRDLELTIQRYSKYISQLIGFSIDVNPTASPTLNALIIDCPSILAKKNYYPKLGEDESYSLNINRSGMFLRTNTLTGIIRGLSTFVQLIERDSSTKKTYVPMTSIFDRPRFPWRGLMLDVCRHWMPVSVIERTLNAMEISKLNVLHLHLSDDQGFRVQSIQYPLLHDRQDYFTQKDIRHIVEYARQRRIRIVPEFDIPGHTTSWFVGYPDLASEQGTYQVETKWGVLRATIDPTREETYTFLDGFFKEMTELFPDRYFHIGGDEVEGSQWTMSPKIQKFIFEHRLDGKNGLQAYFNKRIQSMLKKYEKTMIGWEEILDGIKDGLAMETDAVIQSWKSRKSLAHAIDKGYRVLLSHGYYLDHMQNSIFHYKIDPILNDELWLFNDEQLNHVLGGEACMWTEYVSERSVDSRIWPRLLAIAERFWSPSTVKNEHFLYERLFRLNHLLDKIQTGVTHLSTYRLHLQDLILDPQLKMSLLHPLTILADVCEPYGFEQRAQTNRYSSTVPLTTFTDVLQAESELIWKLENLPIDSQQLRDVFHTWSINHVRLRTLFDELSMNRNRQLWVQDVEQLSKNLAQIGQIGLRLIDYGKKRILHPDKNNTMNSWPLMQWIGHHYSSFGGLENQVGEVRLAAVRPVQRLFKSLEVLTV